MAARVGYVGGPTRGGVYFNDGRYIVRLDKITHGMSQQEQGEYIAAEFTVLQVSVQYENSNVVGSRPSVVYMMKHGNIAIQNLRGLIGAVAGMDAYATDPASPTYAIPEMWREACEKSWEGDGTAFAGTVLDCTATTKLTKKTKQPFTATHFDPVDDETAKALLTDAGSA